MGKVHAFTSLPHAGICSNVTFLVIQLIMRCIIYNLCDMNLLIVQLSARVISSH